MEELVTLEKKEYERLLDCKKRVETSAADYEALRLWCEQNKKISKVEDGVMACALKELLPWTEKPSAYIGWYTPMAILDELVRRLTTYEAEEAAQKAQEQAPGKQEVP